MGDSIEAELGQRVAKIETRTNCKCLCDLAYELHVLMDKPKEIANKEK